MAYKDRDELLDDFFDHIFGEDEPSEDDVAWFEDKIGSFFAKLEGEKPPGRRRSRGQPAAPARRRPGASSDSKTSKSSEGGYGLSLFYGDKKGA